MSTRRPPGYRIAELSAGIRPVVLRFSASCGSTNERAEAAARNGSLTGPTLFVTARQTAGRGRGKNTWWSARGCITATLALPSRPGMSPAELSIRAVASVHRAVGEFSPAPVSIKWPNDLLLNDRKLAGLLCARSGGFDLIGFGINANLDVTAAPDELRRKMTSVFSATGASIDMTALLKRVCVELRHHLCGQTLEPFAAVLDWYSRHHRLTGQPVQVYLADGRRVCGICTGLSPTGQLLLRAGADTTSLSSGHVVWSATAADKRES